MGKLPKLKHSRGSKRKPSLTKARTPLQNWLQLAQLRSEKCELREARVAFEMAFKIAKRMGDLRATMEALAGLLRAADESLDQKTVEALDGMLDALIKRYPKQVPPMAWYCKGVIARHHGEFKRAQHYVLRYIRAVRHAERDPKQAGLPIVADQHCRDEAYAKGWVMLAAILHGVAHYRRARFITEQVLIRYEQKGLRGINGLCYLILGTNDEEKGQCEESMRWYQKAHASFLGEHNWYYHLYALYGYARLNRIQRRYTEAYWYLDLMDKATADSEFGLLRQEILKERARLQDGAVDLLIDSRKCLVKTRESGQISLGKQYVLIHILEALTNAHERSGDDKERGLSKAEIIESVWNERYRPEAHDNKLYYNINRLRKLIEPDVRKPQYLLNWKEGYRLAPGLRIQFIGSGQPLELQGGGMT